MRRIKLRSLLAVIIATSAAQVTFARADDQLNAGNLLERAQRTLAVVVTEAQRDTTLNVEVAKSKPFWDGLSDLNKNLETARAGIQKRDDSFFTGLAGSRASFVQAEIALLMNGGTTEGVASAMKALGVILDTLVQNFSKEAARLKQGGELTAAEEQSLDKLIAQQDELIRKLEEVERNIAKNNAQMQAGIKRIKEESSKLRRARRNVGGFVGGWFAAHFIYDWLWGWHWWWGPCFRKPG